MPRFCTNDIMADTSCEAGTKKWSEMYLKQGPKLEFYHKYNKSDHRSNSIGPRKVSEKTDRQK